MVEEAFRREVSDRINALEKAIDGLEERVGALEEVLKQLITKFGDLEANLRVLTSFVVMLWQTPTSEEIEEVRRYAVERGISFEEAFMDMGKKGILPARLQNAYNFAKVFSISVRTFKSRLD